MLTKRWTNWAKVVVGKPTYSAGGMVRKSRAQELAALRQAYKDSRRWLESALKKSGVWESAISWMRSDVSWSSMSRVSC